MLQAPKNALNTRCLLVVGRILGGSPAVVRPLVNFFRFDGLGLVTMIISFPDLFVDFFLRFDLDDVGAVKLSVEKGNCLWLQG